MDYEKKIKNALSDKSVPFEVQAWLKEQFPELKENEDDRTKKEILDYIIKGSESRYDVQQYGKEKFEKWIAWLEKQLEKQGEKASDKIVEKARTEKQRVLLTETDGVANIDWDTRSLEDARRLLECGLQYIKTEFEKQGEVKTANKVEPKFKVGDIVKHKDNPHLTYILKRFTADGDYEFHAIGKDGNEGCTCFSVVKYQDEWELVEQKPTDEPKFNVDDWIVRELDNTCYQIKKCILNVTNNKYGYDLTSGGHISSQDANFYHLWTIQDAKDGDVLSFNDGHGNDCIDLIKSITDKKIEFWFCLTNGNSYEVFDGITPYTNLASREDATPASKEQRDLLFQKIKEAGYEWDAEKKELRKVKQKPAWSEDDEKKTNYIIGLLQINTTSNLALRTTNEELENWLKELKDRMQKQSTWKPTDEMLEALYKALPKNVMEISEDEMLLDKLYQGLKYGRVLSEN